MPSISHRQPISEVELGVCFAYVEGSDRQAVMLTCTRTVPREAFRLLRRYWLRQDFVLECYQIDNYRVQVSLDGQFDRSVPLLLCRDVGEILNRWCS